jgi:general secretion pathway protein A
MFAAHFKLTAQPFAEHATVAALWKDGRMTEGLARLQYLAEHATLGLVLGASGLGKSALVKRFLHEVRGPACHPVYLHLTHLSSNGLLKLLLAALGETPSRGKERLFAQIVQRARSAEARPLVVLDEAHLLDADSLTDLRLLVSSALDDMPPLKLLLVGQHALAQTLRQAALRDLLDRITVRYHLHPLDRDQTAAYLDFQMKQAGGTGKEFDAASKSLIHDYTGGVPRQVNNLATACLLQAAAANTHHITEAVLQQTLTEFQLP